MAIPFDQISPTRRIPLLVAEFSTQPVIGASDFTEPALILAQMTPAGTATPKEPYTVSSAGQARELFGEGSVAHLMVDAFRKANKGGQLTVIACEDAGGATHADLTITVVDNNPPHASSGTLALYIAGRYVGVAVATSDDEDAIALKCVSAINAVPNLPVTAAQSAGVNTFTLTARNGGTCGNEITFSVGALGAQAEPGVKDIELTYSNDTLTGGAGDPLMSDYILAMGDDPYDIICPSTHIQVDLKSLLDEITGRWDANTALDGIVLAAKRDSNANLKTLAAAFNDERASVIGVGDETTWLSPSWQYAASYAGLAAQSLSADPAATFQLRELPGCWAGKNQDDLDRNDLVLNGIATMVAQNGAALIEFEATTRRKDQFGDSDTSAEDIQIPAIRSRIRRRLRQATQAAYPRYKLANNGAPIKSGQRIITPDIYAAFLLGQAERLEEDGLIEDLNKFRAGLIVERNASNPNRLDAFITPDAINRARVFALNIQMGG